MKGRAMSAERTAESAETASVPASVKSALRTIEILEVLAGQNARMTLSEVQRHTGIPKSSLHGLLQTLVETGWLEVDSRGTAYGIGLRALRIGTAYLESDPVVEAAAPILVDLRDRLNETVHIARLDGENVVYLASRESAHHLRSSSRIGRRLPASATALGKVLLAARSDIEVQDILRGELPALTEHTVTTMPDLLAELDTVRSRGWSLEEEQNTLGLACIAVTIPAIDAPVDALSCSFPVARDTKQHRADIVDALSKASIDIGRLADRRL